MAKIETEFKLPKPRKVDGDFEWLPIVRVGRIIPFGYTQSEEDPQILLPVPEELELLEKAKGFLKQYSLREVSAWLTNMSGREISYVGLRSRIKNEQRRAQELANYRNLAKQYKEAMDKAKKIEERTLGRRGSRDS